MSLVNFLNWLIQQAQAQSGVFDPYRIVLTAMIGILWFLARNMVKNQRDIVSTLNNHMNEVRQSLESINIHMATQNEIQRALLDRVLEAALRVPAKEE